MTKWDSFQVFQTHYPLLLVESKHIRERVNIIHLICLRERPYNFPPKMSKNTELPDDYNYTLRCTPQRTTITDSNRNLHTHVHSSVIHNSLKVATTQVSLMDDRSTQGGWWTIVTQLKRKDILICGTNMDEL